MFLTEKKAKLRIQELSEYRYREKISLHEWQFMESDGDVGTYPDQSSMSGAKKVTVGDRWEGRDLYAWLSKQISIPATWNEKEVIGVFDFGNTGGGHNSGFESLLFINEKPYQGVDSNHKEVFIPSDKIGENVKLDFRLWSGLEGGGMPEKQEHKFIRADLAWFDERVDAYYYDAKAVIETVCVLTDEQYEKHKLLKSLNHSLNIIDWTNPGSNEFYQSVYAASDYLSQELSNIEKHHDITFHLVGHTHIDVAWLWQLKHTREKAARSFSTVLRLMERYPEYLFLQTQPQIYEYIKNDYPAIYNQIKERVNEGRWEAEGGMWLEADSNIPSGESLVRQLLLGTNFLREEFNTETEYLWLPDVFGYSWALPQILKKSGIKTFMTTKISWNQYNRMPHDTFYWRGIDGSEILTHFITTVEPETTSNKFTYNGTVTPQVIKESWEAYKDKNINQDLILSYGYGDGGGGVNRDMLEMRKRINNMPGLPYAKPSRADDYFNKLHHNIQNTKEYVHTWDGELYLEYHRGTYTSQAEVKRMNRKLELLYRETEWLNVLSLLKSDTMRHYPQATLTDGWKIILRNQFHDIIPGSSIREVYEDASNEYQEALKFGNTAWNQGSTGLTGNTTSQTTWTVFNSAPWRRDDLFYIDIDANGIWQDEDGEKLLSQRTDKGHYVEVQNLPSMGYGMIHFKHGEEEPNHQRPFTFYENGLTTPFYKISWNKSGQLTKIFDVTHDRDILANDSRGNVLQTFEDKPLRFDAWDIDIFYQEKMEEITNLKSVTIIEYGQLKAVVRFVWEYGSSTIQQDMVTYTTSRRIDFDTQIDWHEQQRLLKVAFPVDIRSTEATYDIQFGNVKRPTHWNTSWDYARFETVGHQWADLSEGGFGVSLLNDSKYGYDIKDNMMRLSLLKSAVFPDPYADQGEHLFTYSIFPHAGNWTDGDTVREAWQLNNPLTYTNGTAGERGKSLLECTTDNIMIDAVKKAEYSDAVVIRLHEYKGERGKVSLLGDWKIGSWQECDLMERPLEGEERFGDIEFHIKPYEIKSFIVKFTK